MVEDLRKLCDRDYATGALILIHEARRDIGQGWLDKADEELAVAQRLMLMSGAKDIGQFQNSRDLPESVLADRYEARERVEELEEQLDEVDPQEARERIEELEEQLAEIGATVDRDEADADD